MNWMVGTTIEVTSDIDGNPNAIEQVLGEVEGVYDRQIIVTLCKNAEGHPMLGIDTSGGEYSTAYISFEELDRMLEVFKYRLKY